MDEYTWVSWLIGFSALGVALWEGWENRRHNRMSVRPHLSSWMDSTNGRYRLIIKNDGLGPALIREFVVTLDGEVVPGEGSKPIHQTLQKLIPSFSANSYAFLDSNGVLKEGAGIMVFDGAIPSGLTGEDLDSALEPADLLIRYASLYEDGDRYFSARHGHLPRWPIKKKAVGGRPPNAS